MRPPPKIVIYCRLPGLLAQSARSGRGDVKTLCLLVVVEGRLVRDASPTALAQGAQVGMGIVQARRLCPALLAVPLEEVDVSGLGRAFLDTLADLSPVVEPSGPDATYVDMTAYVDMTGTAVDVEGLRSRLDAGLALRPVVGVGVSRLAARAVAESRVDRLEDAAVRWLWPDDPAVVGRLQRLGLMTCDSVAEAGEEALRLHFGRISPLLHRRARGEDLTPVRALYPPPSADVVIDCSETPIDDCERLGLILSQACFGAERQLQELGFGRRLALEIATERGVIRDEWPVPAPIGTAVEIRRAAGRVLGQMHITAPVTRLRLRIEEVSVPKAHTADLFGVQSDSVTLEATWHRLAARFGLTTLTFLGRMPRTARERRRVAVQEHGQEYWAEELGGAVMSRLDGRYADVQQDGSGGLLGFTARGEKSMIPITAVAEHFREWIGVLDGEPERDIWRVETPRGTCELHHLRHPTAEHDDQNGY